MIIGIRMGGEPLCKLLPIAPSTYHAHMDQRSDPSRLSRRARKDLALGDEIGRIFTKNFAVYGVRKIWHHLQREGHCVARCMVELLMWEKGLQGVRRGKMARTTINDNVIPRPLDKINLQFKADLPNQLWAGDFTYVSTWADFAYITFVIDIFARYIAGWRVNRTAHTSFVLDALEQALHQRRPQRGVRHIISWRCIGTYQGSYYTYSYY